jgi:predicted enzyme related to lactoylglutathione lyase
MSVKCRCPPTHIIAGIEEVAMPGFVHVDIAADDPERAAKFYNRIFGGKISKLDGPIPYWLVTPPDGHGPGAGIAKREKPWQKATPTIDVASADAVATEILAQGGKILIPATVIPGVGKLLTFADSEGNIMAALEAAAPMRA